MKERSRTEYSIINIFVNFVGYGLNIVLSFVCRMVFVRFLAEEYLGINGLFSNILSMLSLTELGIGTAIGYALYKPVAMDNKPQITALMRFYGKAYKCIGLIVGGLGLCLLPFLNIIIQEKPDIPENLYLLYLLYLFNTASSYFFSYRSTIIIAYQRNYIVVAINYAMVIVQNIIQIILLALTKNFMLYLITQVICIYVTNFMISWKAKRDYPFIDNKNSPDISKEEKIKLVKDVKALTVTKLAGILVNNTDNIVITYFSGLVTTGIASNYTLLTSTINSLVNQIFGSLSASIGNLNAKESDERKYEFFSVLNLANFWIFGWATIGIICISSDIVQLCFGVEYVLHWSIPLLLAVNFYVVGMQNAVLTYKSTLGLFRYGKYILLITAAINIVGDIVLGEKYGLSGIFGATAIARLLTNAWYDPYAIFKYGLHMNPFRYFFKYLKHGVFLFVVAGISVYVCTFVECALVPQILIKVVICTILPNSIFGVVFYKTKEGKYLFMKAKGILKKFRER